MSDRPAPSPLAAPWHEKGVADAGLSATAQLMLFKPGVYAVSLQVAHSTATDIGLPLPSIRLDPLPPVAGTDGRAFVSMAGEGGWVSRPGDKVFILVAGGTARVILTIYKAGPDAAAPEVRINNITQDALAPAATPPVAEPAGPAGTDPPRVPVEGELPLRIVAHATSGAAVTAGPGSWAGTPGTPLEGITVTAAEDPRAASLEYQAIMGVDWSTPWFEAGAFCGSRGLSLALFGFRVRLLPDLAGTHRCSYWGRFKGGATAGPFTDGAACSFEERELEAVRIVVEPRAEAAPPPAKAAKPRRFGRKPPKQDTPAPTGRSA